MLRLLYVGVVLAAINVNGASAGACDDINQASMGKFQTCKEEGNECEFFTDDGPDRSCRQWCDQSGMTCVGGWKEDDGCGHDDNIGCDEENDDSVCRCQAAPSCNTVVGWDKKTKCHDVCECKDDRTGHHDIICNKVGEEWPEGCDFSDLTGMSSPDWYHSSAGGEIHITGNSKLKTLPTRLFHGTSTYSISISNNALLEKLPNELFYDAETLFLSIVNNPNLKKIHKDLFEGFKSTEQRMPDIVKFQSNGLTEVPAGLFKHKAFVRLLYFVNNKITKFPSGLFEGLSIMMGLNIRQERELNVIEAGAFKGMPRANQIQITRCDKLVTIEQDAMEGQRMGALDAKDNKALEYVGSQAGAHFAEWINLKSNPSLKRMPGIARNQYIKGLQYDNSGVIQDCTPNNDNTGIVCSGCKADSGLSLQDDEANCRLAITTLTTTSGTTTTTTTTVTTIPDCGAGFMLSIRANKCVACPEGQFQSQSNHQYGGCTKHKPCPRGQFISTVGTSSTPNTCTSHAECDGDTQFESVAPTGNGDRVCSWLTVCQPGEHIAKEQTAVFDRTCAQCDPTVWEWSGVENAASCKLMSTCTTDQYVSVAGTAESDLECVPCPDGQYQDTDGLREEQCIHTTTTTTLTKTTTTISSTTTTSTATYSSTTTTTTTTVSSTTTTATTTTTTQSTTTTTTTTLDVAKLREDGGTAAELLKMGADPIKMVESNYTAVELAEAGMSAEDIAAAADAAGSGSTLEVSDLKLVEDMTAEILKENGFSANELMLGGFVAADLEDAGFSASAIKVAQSKYNRANPTNPATSAGTNQTLIIVAAVLILFVVLGAAVYIRRAKGAQQGSGDESPIAFENPMYADGYNGGQQPQGSAGYMDVPAGVGGGFSMQSGYMDVAPTSGGGASAAYMDVAPTENFDGSSMQSGYMDVAPTSGGGASAAYMDVAPTENFDGGFGGDGFDSDDEEV